MSQGIEFNRLMLDMRSMQMDAMAQPKSVAVPQVGGSSFSDMLGQAVNKVNDTQQASEPVGQCFRDWQKWRRPDGRNDLLAESQCLVSGVDPGS